MNTSLRLIQHIEQFTGPIELRERDAILSYFTFQKALKKQDLQEANKPCDTLCFVIQGCMRSYYIKPTGLEQTVDFAIENWWLTDYLAFEQRKPSSFYLQAVEPTMLYCINSQNYQVLLAAHPIMEKYFRLLFQKAYGAAQYRLKFLYEFSREELYFHFEEQFPTFVQRIPQYLLASYLGFSPEYLSEIKKKRFS